MRALAVLFVASSATAAPALTFQSDPYPGIHRETWTDAAIPARIRLMRIDLTSSEIAVYATKEADRGLTTSDYAARANAQVAINGDFFLVNGYVPRGLAIGDSSAWSTTSDNEASAIFHFRREGERTVATIIPPEGTYAATDLPAGTAGAVSGRPLLVRQSLAVTSFDCADPITIPCQPAPRSAVAVSPDGNTLWLVVVDGWQSSSYGLTAPQLADFLRARGAGMAMGLDVGSSSTLVQDGTVISSPSDGIERTVANHLAVKYGMLPKGEIYGLICKHSVIDCATDTPSRRIAGAAVTLDDGRSIVTDTTGAYDFVSVTPRLACVTVKKTGYLTVHQCRQVEPGVITYNSVALWEGTDPIDAGVGDDSGLPPDASATGDAQTGDGGNGYVDPLDGCHCESGRPPNMVVLVVVAFFLTRRRGKTA
jgi:exopolysaccharide biosynthesis protein